MIKKYVLAAALCLLFTFAALSCASSSQQLSAGENETLITLTRERGFAGSARTFNVYIDGKIMGKIANGKTLSFVLPKDNHSIYTEIDGYKSNEIRCNAKTDTLKLSVSYNDWSGKMNLIRL